MKKWLSLLGLGAGLLGAACRETPGNPPSKDMSVPTQDMPINNPGDLAMPDMTAGVETSANAVNTGAHTSGTVVTIKGMVVTGIASFNGTTGGGICRYRAWMQDPSGQAPSGMLVTMLGKRCVMPDGGGTCRCDFPPQSGVDIDKVTTLGDVFTVTGKVFIGLFTDADAGVLPPQHSVDASSLTLTGSGGVVTPQLITDGSLFASFGMGYAMYENMLVKVEPAAPAMAGMPNNFGDYDYAGGRFGDLYRFVYAAGLDGATFPAAGSTWKSISGVAFPAFGGTVNPRIMADFAP